MRYQDRVRCIALVIVTALVTYVSDAMADSVMATTPIRITDLILIAGMIAQSGMVFYFAGGMASRVRALETWRNKHDDENRDDFSKIPSRDFILTQLQQINERLGRIENRKGGA